MITIGVQPDWARSAVVQKHGDFKSHFDSNGFSFRYLPGHDQLCAPLAGTLEPMQDHLDDSLFAYEAVMAVRP